MKKLNAVVVAVFLTVGFLVNSVLAEVRIINHGGASLPVENLSDSWAGASANWMTLLRTGGNSVGSGKTQVVREHDLGDYKKMITSSTVKMWKGTPDLLEYGNFWYQGIQIRASDGDTFVPSEVTLLWETIDSGVVNQSGTISFTTLDSLRQVLNPDNSTPSPVVVDSALPASNFLFGGVGRAVTLLPGSDVQSRIDATSDYWWARDYKIRYTITVPYKNSLGVSQTPIVNIFEVSRIKPQTAIVGTSLVLTNTAVGKKYTFQFSPTMENDWDNLGFQFGSVDPVYFDMIHLIQILTGLDPENAQPKMFYRVAY